MSDKADSRRPRWVTVLAILGVVLVGVVVLLHLTGVVPHGHHGAP